MYKEQLAAYTEVLFKQMFSRELSKALSWSSPMNKPTAILLAGQPGAGKTQLSEAHRNLIIEGTGRTTEVPIHTANLLIAKGYRVSMAVIAVRPELSLLSTLHRFCSMSEMGTVPRPTAVLAHNTVIQNLPYNLDILYQSNLFTEMQIIDRREEIVWCSTHAEGMPSEALTAYWESNWTEEERKDAEETIAFLLQREGCLSKEQMTMIEEIQRALERLSK